MDKSREAVIDTKVRPETHLKVLGFSNSNIRVVARLKILGLGQGADTGLEPGEGASPAGLTAVCPAWGCWRRRASTVFLGVAFLSVEPCLARTRSSVKFPGD